MCFIVRHIKKTDGFTGLYRGLVPRLMSTYMNGLVSAAVADVSWCNHSVVVSNVDWHCCAISVCLLSNGVCIGGRFYKEIGICEKT